MAIVESAHGRPEGRNDGAERAYNVRAAIPNHAAVFLRWRRRSAVFRDQALSAFVDQPYGEHPLARFDLFRPIESVGRRVPCLVFYHGGYWQAMDKADSSFLADPWVRQGFAVCVVGYPKCPHVSLSTVIAHSRAAFLALIDRARSLGLHPDRLHAIGHSAGGHLAVSLLTEPETASQVRSVTAISGLFDLSPLMATSMNDALQLDPNTAHRLSPIYRRPLSTEIPVLLAWGGAETSGFADQVDALEAAWAGHGVRLERLPMPGCDHFQAVEALADPSSVLAARVLELALTSKGPRTR